MILRPSLGALLVSSALAVLPLSGSACSCDGPPGEGEGDAGEGEGDAGEGEGDAGEGEGEGDPQPPTEPIRDPNPNDPNNANLDSDCDGLTDFEEFTTVYAGGATTNPADYDSDGDGIADGIEAGRAVDIDAECPATWKDADTTNATTSPVSTDSDGDCIGDGDEDHNKDGKLDPGETDPAAPDSDHDGIPDGVEDGNCNGVVDTGETSAADVDSDQDGLNDGVEDANHNGTVDPGELDPLNPDSDGDGIPDGVDPDPFAPNPDDDHDGIPNDLETAHGVTNPNNPDSDGDGLCDGPGTVQGVCVPGEDLNINGIVDANETDPNRTDTDCDGVSDKDELVTFHTNPRVRDTDGDLLTDGVETGATGPVANSGCANVPVDTDPSTTTDPVRADTDGDGINDGTEDKNLDGALAPPNPGGTQETDPKDADTDNDGICDGPSSAAGVCAAGEDLNRNGRVDAGESDPRVADVDSDGDGLTDPVEAALGTDPQKADTDGDGLNDGDEVQHGTDPLHIDTDCDGIPDGTEVNTTHTNPLERDTDGDGILDGVETGTACRVGGTTAQTDAQCTAAGAPLRCVPDADAGATTTDPDNNDTDGDSVADGAEDSNQNGQVDAGELNPNDPGDVGLTDVAACGLENLRDVNLVNRPDDTADLILAVPVDFPGNRITELKDGGGAQIGAMVFDTNDQVAGVAMKLDVAGNDATQELATLEGILASGAVGTVTAVTNQAFASWDSPGGNNAAIGKLTFTAAANGNTAAALNAIVSTLVPGATGVLDTSGATDTGPFKLQVEVLDRSASSTIVVVSLAQAARAAGNEGVGFKLDDLANGTAVAQFGDDTGVQCDRFTVLPLQKVDFLLIVDNSGSMDNEQTAVANSGAQIGVQLSNSTVDFRIATITSNIDQLGNDATAWSACELGSGGACSATSDQAKVYCPFTANTATVSACVNQLSTNGSGEETFFRPFACMLGRVLNGDGIDQNLGAGELGGPRDGEMCGRNTTTALPTNLGRAPYLADATYQAPPGGFVLLPRADNDPHKIRTGAQLVVVFITDANEQSDGRYSRTGVDSPAPAGPFPTGNPVYPGDAVALKSLPAWVSFFANFDGAGDPILSRALVHGLVCPNGTGCTDESGNYENPRFQSFLSSLGGIEAALPDNADPNNAAEIQSAIAAILQASIAQSSPYVLEKPPISATIKIALTAGSTQGACNTDDVPRSRVNGFDYDGATNSITLFGDCRPKLDNSAVGTPFSVSYKFWIEDSPDPDGGNDVCTCQAPFVCGPNNVCECPADCGLAGGLQPGQTCNAQCQPECLPDCGGCANGAVCNSASADCSCTCPSDCNTGAPLPANQVCDPATCLPTCAPGGCAGAPPGPNFVCGADCTYQCPSDCGGTLSATQTCDTTTCTAACSPDCNATCGGFSTCNSDPAICACECAASATCGPGFTFNPDPSVCGCVCDAAALACPAGHQANLTDCRCDCIDDQCGGQCGAGTVCNAGTCTCIPIGG